MYSDDISWLADRQLAEFDSNDCETIYVPEKEGIRIGLLQIPHFSFYHFTIAALSFSLLFFSFVSSIHCVMHCFFEMSFKLKTPSVITTFQILMKMALCPSVKLKNAEICNRNVINSRMNHIQI